MAIIFLGPINGPSTRAFDADTLAWEAAVIANGGSVSLTRRIIVDQFIFDEKASGAWALTDDYWGLWGENEPQALTSLKQRRLASAINSPTFVADRDYAFDGLSQYLRLGFIPSTHGINFTGTSQRLAVYERTNVSSSGFAIGSYVSSTRNNILNPRTGANAYFANLNSQDTTSGTSTDSRGLTSVYRTTGPTWGIRKNGIAANTFSPASNGTTASNLELYLGCYNSGGSPLGFRASSIGFVVIGGPLSDSLEAAQYASIQAWATSVGAQV